MRGLENTHLRWACRRGMLELDLLLLPFFDAEGIHFSETDKQNFSALLSEADQDIYAWILNIHPCPHPSFIPLIQSLQSYHHIEAAS